MSEEEAVEFVGSSIELAMDRDGSSGGVVRIYVINRNGKKKILRTPEKYDVQKKIESDQMKPSNILSHFAPAVR
jgi:20S proteasome alpha/beta subunit